MSDIYGQGRSRERPKEHDRCRTISDCVWEIRLRPPAAKQRSRLCRRLHTVSRRPRGRCAEPSRTIMQDGGVCLEGRLGDA